MEDTKVTISKGLANYIKKAIAENYGKVSYFSKRFKLNEVELNISLTEQNISIKTLACLYEPLKLSSYDESTRSENLLLLKQEIKDTRKSMRDFEDEIGYEDGSVTRAINRKRISPELEENLSCALEKWKPLRVDSKLSLTAKYAVDFNTQKGYEAVLKVFKNVISHLTKNQLLFLCRNIEYFCFMDNSDWELLYLIQGLNNMEFAMAEDFIEKHAIEEKSWKLQISESLKNTQIDKMEGVEKKKPEYIAEIVKGIEKHRKNLGLRYLTINLLLKMMPYIFYLTESDWRILGKFSLLENWDNRKTFFLYKNWANTYIRGLIYSK